MNCVEKYGHLVEGGGGQEEKMEIRTHLKRIKDFERRKKIGHTWLCLIRGHFVLGNSY